MSSLPLALAVFMFFFTLILFVRCIVVLAFIAFGILSPLILLVLGIVWVWWHLGEFIDDRWGSGRGRRHDRWDVGNRA